MVEASPVLSECVRILGRKNDVLPYIVASDTLVLPSAFEGVPLVMIEAILAERPIVVSRVSGLDAYLPNALLFPPGDSDALGVAISRLIADPSERRRLEERAATAATGPYSWDRVAEKTSAVYEQVLA